MSLTHKYRLAGSFADDNGGPSLDGTASALSAAGYVFFGDLFPLSLPGVLTTGVYSIVMRFHWAGVVQINAYQRLLDWKNRAEDYGLYSDNSRQADFFQSVTDAEITGPPVFTAAGVDYTLILTRDAVGLVAVYVNGALQVTVDDSVSQDAVCTGPGNILHFFTDNVGGVDNLQPGVVDYIAIYSHALTPADVAEVTTVRTAPNAAASGAFNENFTTHTTQAAYRLAPLATEAGLYLGWWADLFPKPPAFPNPVPRHEYEVAARELRPSGVPGATVELYVHGFETADLDVQWTMGAMTDPARYATFIWRLGPAALDQMYYVEHFIDPSGTYAPHPLVMSYADYRPEWIGDPPLLTTLATSDLSIRPGDVVRLVAIGEEAWFLVNGRLALYTDQVTNLAGHSSVGMGGYSNPVTGLTSYRAMSVRAALAPPTPLAPGSILTAANVRDVSPTVCVRLLTPPPPIARADRGAP